MTAQNILINEWWFVAAVAAVFAYVGVRQGMTVGQFMLIGIVVGILLADRLAKFMEPWINISYQMMLAVVREHATSPDALIKTMFSQPQLITQNWQRLDLGTLMFGLVTQWTGSMRTAIFSLIVLFVSGLLVLITVNVPLAIQEAGNAVPENLEVEPAVA